MFQEFLIRREDYLRALRGFLRELVRQVRSEYFPFVSFARGLMQDVESVDVTKLEQGMKVRIEARACQENSVFIAIFHMI